MLFAQLSRNLQLLPKITLPILKILNLHCQKIKLLVTLIKND